LKYIVLNPIRLVVGLIVLGSLSLNAKGNIDGETVVNTKCIACHTDVSSNKLTRISEQRKTPEGWFMTITRMQSANGLAITEEEKMAAVKYLSDTQGITPNESKKYRYILEQQPNIQETSHDTLLTEMCVRCHSAARVGLQRRSTQEWNKLIDFHLGHFPTIEYHALSRDRDWLNIAKDEVVPYLGKEFNLEKKEWNKWAKQFPNRNIDGSWVITGHTLGAGDFIANLKLEKLANDNFNVEINGKYLDGRPLKGKGNAILYSGYELRTSLTINDIEFKQVLAISKDNKSLKGRMFETLHPEEGSSIEGLYTKDVSSKILNSFPKSIKKDSKAILTIVGNNLNGKISLPKGIKVKKVLERTNNKIVLDVYSTATAQSLNGDIKVGSSVRKNALAVYDKVDNIKVFPQYAIARVGDGGGKMPKQHAIFEAYGFNAGKDNKIGTADDIPLGVVNASWRIEAFNEIAKHDEDVKYVGTIDTYSGRFTPSFAGPNPKRKFSTNNAGNIKVIATYKDENKEIQADSHLIVTVQKWVNPPIN